MGVYIFRCLRAPYVKVGHHKVTSRRPNAYYRIAGRGLQSVVHPPELDGLLSTNDLSLVAWYPGLTRQDERCLHRACTTRVGEFHPASELETILARCDEMGERVLVTERERVRAMNWGRRRARAAARRRRRKEANGA